MYNSIPNPNLNSKPVIQSNLTGQIIPITDADRAIASQLDEDSKEEPAVYQKDFTEAQTILTALWKYPHLFDRTKGLVKPEHFEDKGHSVIMRCLAEYHDAHNAMPDLQTLCDMITEKMGAHNPHIYQYLGEAQAVDSNYLPDHKAEHYVNDFVEFAKDAEYRLALSKTLTEAKYKNNPVARNAFMLETLQRIESIGKGTAKQPYRFAPITSKDFASADYKLEWLVKGLLVKDQPGIIGGPKKALKTSIMLDLALSLGSGTPFLGKWAVSRPVRCAVISGESGKATLQETALRICKAKGIKVEDTLCYWDFRLPQLSQDKELDELANGLAELKIEAVCIDPLYLCLLAGKDAKDKNAANLFDMGPLLANVSDACLRVGATPILAHHSRKGVINPYDPLDLDDLSFAGVQEFARQWVLVNRREKYLGGGFHRLWMQYGGSAGHNGTFGVDVDEGTIDDNFDGRKWDVSILSFADLQTAKVQARADKQAAKDEAEDKALLNTLDIMLAHPDKPPTTKRALRSQLGWDYDKTNKVFARLDGKSVHTVKMGKYETVQRLVG
jgi:replicative DNA helicase